jgi:hypothetical protein
MKALALTPLGGRWNRVVELGKKRNIQALFGIVVGFTQITGLPVEVVFKPTGPWVSAEAPG